MFKLKSPFEGFAVRVVSSAVAMAAMVSACGGGDDDDGSEPQAGSGGESSAGTSGRGGSAGKSGAGKGGSGNASGGTNAEAGNAGSGENLAGETGVGGSASGSGGGAGETGEGGAGADDGQAGSGGGSMLDDSGKASLDGEDGITGVASGMLFARTMNLETNVNTPGYLLIEADDGAQGNWTLRIPAKLGVYSCDAQAGDDVASISLNDAATSEIRGTTAKDFGGACILEVTSFLNVIEGRFTATLAGIGGALHPVTAGYFHFSRSPIGDCTDAEDPGVSDSETAATIAIQNIEPGRASWRCGQNAKLPATNSIAGTDPLWSFNGTLDDRETLLRIAGISGTGTFSCGTDKVALTIDSFWGGDSGGTCTIEVTEFGPDGIVGSYEAALWNGIVAAHATLDIVGSFRTKPTFP